MDTTQKIPAHVIDTVMECLSLTKQHPLRAVVQEVLTAYEELKTEANA